MNVFLVALLLSPSAPAADTVLALRRGDRVVIENLSGEVLIEGWGRGDLEVTSLGRREEAIVVRRDGSQVTIAPDDRKGRGRGMSVSVRVPEWANVTVRGRSLDVTARATGGSLSVSILRGDVRVENTRGDVTVSAISGEVAVFDASGGVTVSAQSDNVRLERVRGIVVARAGEGDIDLIDVESTSIEAETQEGDITFSGSILAGGVYGFFVHDGDATISIPASSAATVSASTFEGEFESEFPVLVERFTGGREFDFKLGDGNARIRIQVFDGQIRLLKRR